MLRTVDFEGTVTGDVENPGWWQPIKSGAFREYYEKQYRARFEEAEGSA